MIYSDIKLDIEDIRYYYYFSNDFINYDSPIVIWKRYTGIEILAN